MRKPQQLLPPCMLTAVLFCFVMCSGIDFEVDGGVAFSKRKAENVALFNTLTERLNGHVLPVHKAMQIMSVIRSRSVTPTSKMRCARVLPSVNRCLRVLSVNSLTPVALLFAHRIDLGCRGTIDIGGVVHIPIRTYGKTMEAKLPSMKKLSSAAAADADGGVAMDRQYRSADDLSKEIPPEDRVKSYRYGKELFPVAPTDEALMKYEDEKCLQLLCFTSASKLPRECWGAIRRLLLCCVTTLGSECRPLLSVWRGCCGA